MYFPFVFCTPVTFRIKPFGAELVIPETMTSPFLYLGFESKVILSSSTNIGCLSLSYVIIFTLSFTTLFSSLSLLLCDFLYPSTDNVETETKTSNTTTQNILLFRFFTTYPPNYIPLLSSS